MGFKIDVKLTFVYKQSCQCRIKVWRALKFTTNGEGTIAPNFLIFQKDYPKVPATIFFDDFSTFMTYAEIIFMFHWRDLVVELIGEGKGEEQKPEQGREDKCFYPK